MSHDGGAVRWVSSDEGNWRNWLAVAVDLRLAVRMMLSSTLYIRVVHQGQMIDSTSQTVHVVPCHFFFIMV